MTFRVRDLMAGVAQEQDKDRRNPSCPLGAQDSCGSCTNKPCDGVSHCGQHTHCGKHSKKPHLDEGGTATLGQLRSAMRQALGQV